MMYNKECVRIKCAMGRGGRGVRSIKCCILPELGLQISQYGTDIAMVFVSTI